MVAPPPGFETGQNIQIDLRREREREKCIFIEVRERERARERRLLNGRRGKEDETFLFLLCLLFYCPFLFGFISVQYGSSNISYTQFFDLLLLTSDGPKKTPTRRAKKQSYSSRSL